MSYLFKTVPYAHQLTALERSANASVFALLMQMRTGKTKIIIDTATHLYSRGKITAVIVIAPKGVHRNWVTTEIPAHCPDEVQPVTAYWANLSSKKDREEWEKLFDPSTEGLRYATLNFDAVIKPKGKRELKRLLTTFDCLFVLDESHCIKTPGIQTTKLLHAAAKYAPYRRIMTGTASTNLGPLDLWSQFKFLDPEILGHSAYTSFKAEYAVTEVKLTSTGWGKLRGHYDRRGLPPPSLPTIDECRRAGLDFGRDYFEKITGYDNIASLRTKIAPYSVIVRREECEDMPAIVRQRIEVELTAEQRRIYDEMRKDAIADLNAPPNLDGLSLDEQLAVLLFSSDTAKAKNALVKVLRLAQILGGHVPDTEGRIRAIKSNRLKTVLDRLDDIDGKVIIWSRFRPELEELEAALVDKYGRAAVVAYHGGVSDDAREEAKHRFQNDPSCLYFVGNPRSGGTGLPLHAADTMIYYSCEPSAETRWQSEERATITGKEKVLILDVVVPGTVDEKVLDSLSRHKETADEVLRYKQAL